VDEDYYRKKKYFSTVYYGRILDSMTKRSVIIIIVRECIKFTLAMRWLLPMLPGL